MPDVPVLISTAGAALGLLITVAGGLRWFVRTQLPKIREKRAIQKATDEVIRGRAAIPFNEITGAQAQEEIPPLGTRLTLISKLLEDIHHELHPNNGSSMKDSLTRVEARVETIDRRLENGDRRFERIEHAIHDELQVAQDALGNAAEAAAHLLPTIHDAIKAQPPEE